jgi:hypothetical protein
LANSYVIYTLRNRINEKIGSKIILRLRYEEKKREEGRREMVEKIRAFHPESSR